jgi:hypothetical protein
VKHATTARLFWAFTGLSVVGVALFLAGSAFVGKSSAVGAIGGGVLGLIGFVAILLAGIIDLVAWIGTLIHTARHERWVWFLVVLLLAWTWFAMLAYVLFAPRDAKVPARTLQRR